MKSSLILGLCVAMTAFGAPHKRQADDVEAAAEIGSQLDAAAAEGIDKDFLASLKDIFLEPSTTMVQKKAQIDELVHKLPQDQQEKIAKFEQQAEEKKEDFFSLAKEHIESVGGETQTLGEQIFGVLDDENLTLDQMKDKVVDMVGKAPEAVQQQLKELGKKFQEAFAAGEEQA